MRHAHPRLPSGGPALIGARRFFTMSASVPASPSKPAVFARRLGSTLGLWGVIALAVWSGHWAVLFAIIAGLAALGLWEWSRLFGPLLPGPQRVWLYLVSAVYGGLVLWRTKTTGTGELGAPETVAVPTLLFGLFALTLGRPLEGRDTLWRLFVALTGFIYVPFLFSFAWRLVIFPAWEGGALPGVAWLLFVVAVTKFTDMGAYAVGVVLGRHKMIPHISPGKTWEGLGGAFLGALLAAHGSVACFGDHLPGLTHGHATVLAFLLGAITVVADLAESVLKRCLEVKDSGQLLPGIGGALDLIDSLLFTLPAAWLYFHWLASIP